MAAGDVAASGASGVMDKGLKKGAVGYVSNIVIGVASTAPAYSLAATLGFIVAVKGVGVHAPAVMIVAFIPMLLVASAYKYFNKADPDAGTTFAWTTRAFGPMTGWVNGWAIFLADVIVMASLSDIAAIYTFKLFGFTELGESKARDHRRRRPVDRADDMDLLPRHRALGENPDDAAGDRGRDPRALLGRRVRQGLRQQPAGRLDQAVARLDQPLRDELGRPRRGGAGGLLHLLGLGFGRRRQRGVRGSDRGARARRPSSRRSCSC